MGGVLGMVRGGRRAWLRVRFTAWSLRLRLALARHGGRLIVSAPDGAPVLEDWPVIRMRGRGEGDGTLTLRFGEDVSVGRSAVIDVWARGDSVLEVGRGTRIEDGVRLHLRGGHMHIGEHSSLCEGGVVDVSGLLVTGRNAVFGTGAVVRCLQRIELGDGVELAERCSLSDSEHPRDGEDALPTAVDPIEIQSDTLVGPNCVIAPGVVIGRGSMVEAGALLVPGEYPSGWLLAGSPARAVRPLADGNGNGNGSGPLGHLPDPTAG